MRKFLLATTALVGFALSGAAQAAVSPLAVTIGGGVEFAAGAAHESKASGATNVTGGDFETIYTLDFGVTGKSANGMEYGGKILLDNDVYAYTLNSPGSEIRVMEGSVFLSGAFGKLVLGDSRGATSLQVKAPSVVGVRYIDFLGAGDYAKDIIIGVDGKDHSTNVTYFTPKIGNELHKVQAGVTYAPHFYQYGSDVQRTGTSSYRNVVKGAIAYTGNFKPVAVTASADIVTAAMSRTRASSHDTRVRPFSAYEFGLQAAYDRFTVGANYSDAGHGNTNVTQNKDQQIFGAGVKYDLNNLALGFNYIGGEGYSQFTDWTSDDAQYVKSFNTYGLGGAYSWAPGLTTNVNGVLFDQKTGAGVKNDGYVLLVSQKLAF
jgi:hypothetical protein